MDPLLECVTAVCDERAVAAWARWRSATVIDTLPWRDALLVPMIPEARRRICQAGDPAAPVLTGFVRRAWAQGAMFAARARDVVGRLRAADVGPVMIGGSTAAFLHGGDDGAVRPPTDTTIFVPRHRLDEAVRALRRDRWKPRTRVPSRPLRGWTNALVFDRGTESLRVAWRHVEPPPWRSRAVERVLFERPMEPLSTEALLLSRLAENGGWDGVVPWQADVAFLAARVEAWEDVFEVARTLAPTVHDRLWAAHGSIPGVPRPCRQPPLARRCEDAVGRGMRKAATVARRVVGRR